MVVPATPDYQRRSEASAVSLKNGNVLLVWCDLAGNSDNAHGFISARELTAAGAPTGEPRLVIPSPPGGLNTLSPALQRLGDGSIGMAFSYPGSITREGEDRARKLLSGWCEQSNSSSHRRPAFDRLSASHVPVSSARSPAGGGRF
jgi:hypothetical protein